MTPYPYPLLRMSSFPLDWLTQLQALGSLKLEELTTAIRQEAMLLRDSIRRDYAEELSPELNQALEELQPIDRALLMRTEHTALRQALAPYTLKAGQVQHLQAELKASYQKEYAEIAQRLLDFSKNSELLQGIQMAAPILYEQLLKYQETAVADFRKKERQTQRGLMRYLKRAMTKPSPFGTFAATQFAQTAEQEAITSARFQSASLPLRQHAQWNQQLWGILRQALSNEQPLLELLELRLNPSLHDRGANYVFLQQAGTLEAFQQIPKTPTVARIVELLQEKPRSLQALRNTLMGEVDASEEELDQYLHQLLHYGLLHHHWGIHRLEEFWMVKLLTRLRQDFGHRIELRGLREQLETAEYLRLQFEKQSETARQETLVAIQNCWKKVFQSLDLELDLPAHQLLYLNSEIDAELKVSRYAYEQLLDKLNRLMRLLQPLYVQQNERKSLQRFFLKEFGTEASIDLLSFYLAYVEGHPPVEETLPPPQLVYWKAALIQRLHRPIQQAQERLYIYERDLLEAAKAAGYQQGQQQRYSYGALIQPYHKDRLKAVVDNVFGGHGKQLGRFLLYSDREYIQAARIWQRDFDSDAVFVEDADNSSFGANVHPAVLPYQLESLDADNGAASSIPVKDLWVRYDAAAEELVLQQASTGKRVFVEDMGLQALETRRPFYRFLQNFSSLAYGHPRHIIDLVHENLLPEGPLTKGICIPRIVFEEQLVLQRQTWFIPKAELPLRQAGEEDLSYFRRLQQWLKDWKIPHLMFFTLHEHRLSRGAVEGLKKDDYKPQFIDFKNPLLLPLVEKLFKRVPKILKIQEMLPLPEHLPQIGKQRYAHEWLLNWHSSPLRHDVPSVPKSQEERMACLSVHLYYNNIERLLTQALPAFLKEAKDKGLFERFFYIRYWEKGPHLRLRLFGNKEILQKQLRPLLEQHFFNFYQQKPSRRFNARPGDFANNSIQFIDYQAEMDRYGGSVGLQLAEWQFQQSSQTLLELLPQFAQKQQKMGLALQMHLVFVHSIGFSLEQAKLFFMTVSSNWRKWLLYQVEEHEHYQKRKHIRERFEQDYQQQRSALLNSLQPLWDGLRRGIQFKKQWINHWRYDHKQWSRQVQSAFDKGELRPAVAKFYDIVPSDDPRKNLWQYYEDMLHLHNNRIGLSNEEEAFLGYLLMRVAEEL